MIYIGMDDTDTLQTRGTGHLARTLAAQLTEIGDVFGVSRHQLLFDPRVPYTAKNSCACVQVDPNEPVDLNQLSQTLVAFMREHYVEGSDPGLCIAIDVPEAITAFGQRAKAELVTQAEARSLAAEHGLFLRGLGGTEDGIIGALSAVGLAATGQDGRFPMYGGNRQLVGLESISAILATGIAEVRDTEENTITEGLVETEGKARPAYRDGVAILYVARDGGHWRAIKRD